MQNFENLLPLTPSLSLKFFTATLCLWGTKLEDVTIIGMRWAVCSLDVCARSWKSARLISLHFSTFLFPFRFTEKQGIIVSGPTSLRYSIASSSCTKGTIFNGNSLQRTKCKVGDFLKSPRGIHKNLDAGTIFNRSPNMRAI